MLVGGGAIIIIVNSCVADYNKKCIMVILCVFSGFAKAFGSLGMSLLGAVAGLADHPIQNVHEANNTREVISGVVSGFAKGVVGMVTKPIGE